MHYFIQKYYQRKLFILFTLFFICFIDSAFSQTKIIKSSFIKNIIECQNNNLSNICENIILKTEKLQLEQSSRGNYRCQTSLLGAQTEIIKKIYFDKKQRFSKTISIPFVIKNCKL